MEYVVRTVEQKDNEARTTAEDITLNEYLEME